MDKKFFRLTKTSLDKLLIIANKHKKQLQIFKRFCKIVEEINKIIRRINKSRPNNKINIKIQIHRTKEKNQISLKI